jgi:Skp family chaperone for outer membrane proteins
MTEAPTIPTLFPMAARPRLLVAGTILLLVSFAAVGVGAETESERHRALRVAVVNVDSIFEDCKQWEDVRDELRRLREKASSTLKKYERQIRLLRSEYENLPAGTERARKKGLELQSTLQEFQNSRREFEEQLSRKRTEALSGMLKRMGEVVAQYARENEIDLVLKAGRVRLSPGSDPESSTAALRRAAIADVLFARKRYDISEEIVRRLNAAYPQEIIEPPQK